MNFCKPTVSPSQKNPAIATTYTGHGAQATVATYSPSGYYIASGGT
jgi:hypothetical protein